MKLGRNVLLTAVSIVGIIIIAVAAGLYYMFAMPGQSADGDLPRLTSSQQQLRERLQQHVEHLAGTIGERNADVPGSLAATLDYLEARFEQMGLAPQRLEYAEKDGKAFANLEVEIPGTERADEVIVLGAHYDTVFLTPGADDNASGVAALLEIARAMADQEYARTVRFVAFANEESPYYGTSLMGSRVYAQQASEHQENIVGMFSLEMLGYYDEAPGSQQYPPPMAMFYPDRAHFIAFVANINSRDLLHRTLAAFRRHAALPSEGLAAPIGLVPDIARSDHAMFWLYGYPAVMITDTSNFRNEHYHHLSDMPDTLDYERMTLLVEGLTAAFSRLADDG